MTEIKLENVTIQEILESVMYLKSTGAKVGNDFDFKIDVDVDSEDYLHQPIKRYAVFTFYTESLLTLFLLKI